MWTRRFRTSFVSALCRAAKRGARSRRSARCVPARGDGPARRPARDYPLARRRPSSRAATPGIQVDTERAVRSTRAICSRRREPRPDRPAACIWSVAIGALRSRRTPRACWSSRSSARAGRRSYVASPPPGNGDRAGAAARVDRAEPAPRSRGALAHLQARDEHARSPAASASRWAPFSIARAVGRARARAPRAVAARDHGSCGRARRESRGVCLGHDAARAVPTRRRHEPQDLSACIPGKAH